MSYKAVIVGGVAGGASAAARLRRLSEDNQIIIFERGPHVSFSNCSLPYHLSGMIEKSEELVLLHPWNFSNQYNIDARVQHEVLSIDRGNKTVSVKNLATGEHYTENYDKLILSPGAAPIVPPIEGIEKANIFTVRSVPDIERINQAVTALEPRNITVIGGGFIGVETAENLREKGLSVTLIEAMPQILRQFDFDMVQILHKELYDNGVHLILGDRVTSFTEKTVVLESGKIIDSPVIILAIGVSPETLLARKAGLDLGKTGAIKVDQNFRTNDDSIYAIGDAIEVYNPLFNDFFRLPLAGPAQKQARHVADHIHGLRPVHGGFIGSSVIKVFAMNAASTGLSEDFIHTAGIKRDYEVVKVIPRDKVGLMPDSAMLHFKLLFDRQTGKILGAQAIGAGNVDKRIDIIATLIKTGGTIFDLKDLELCYAPPFGTARDVVNFAGLVATNLQAGIFKQAHDYQIRKLIEQNAFIVDIREKEVFAKGHLKTAINIPFSEIRQRLSEFPKDRPVYIQCRTGQDSYNVVLTLQHRGHDNVYNLCGGFMGISFFEYFTDQTLSREPVLTGYNFD
jgi:NADPH-dependent 2,4-dienoyl-CoA reductase/sulfur reductase-like enzyme/rhodanese-related sulfurtransferase